MRKVRFKLPFDFKPLSHEEVVRKQTQFSERVFTLYGTTKTDEDYEFLNALYQRANFKRLAPIFLLSFMLAIGSHAPIFMILFQPQRHARCYIEGLETFFTFQQILNMSVRDYDPEILIHCHYDKRNYSELVKKHEYKYEEIMEEVRKYPAPSSEECTQMITKPIEGSDDDGTSETINDYFNLYCASPMTKQIIEIILKYGQLTLSLPIGIFADYKGRRPAGLVGGGFLSIGLCMIFIAQKSTIMIGRFFLGSFMIFYYTVFVIYIESTTSNSRRIMAWLLHFGISISKCIQWLLYKYCHKWRTISMINVICCIFILIFLIFTRESSRYLYFRGNKKSAYSLLGIDRRDMPDVNEKTDSIWNHLKNYAKPVFKRRIIVQFLTIFCASSVIYLDRNKFTRVITDQTLLAFLDSGSCMGFVTIMTYFLMFVLGRIPTYIWYFSISFFLSAILFLNPDSTSIYAQIALIVQLSFTENLVFFNFYCISELYPNEFRFTTYGILCSVPGLSEICHFHAGSYRIPQKCMLYMPLFILSAISMCFTHFLKAETKNYHLPDYPKEAVRPQDYKLIVESLLSVRRT